VVRTWNTTENLLKTYLGMLQNGTGKVHSLLQYTGIQVQHKYIIIWNHPVKQAHVTTIHARAPPTHLQTSHRKTYYLCTSRWRQANNHLLDATQVKPFSPP
jgi:hypothetical protein